MPSCIRQLLSTDSRASCLCCTCESLTPSGTARSTAGAAVSKQQEGVASRSCQVVQTTCDLLPGAVMPCRWSCSAGSGQGRHAQLELRRSPGKQAGRPLHDAQLGESGVAVATIQALPLQDRSPMSQSSLKYSSLTSS